MLVSVLRVVRWTIAPLGRDVLLLGYQISFTQLEPSLQLNGFFLKDGVQGVLKGSLYCPVDMIFLILRVSIDRIRRYIKCSRTTKTYGTRSSLTSKVISGN